MNCKRDRVAARGGRRQVRTRVFVPLPPIRERFLVGPALAADCAPGLSMGDSVLVEARSGAELVMLVKKGRASFFDQPSIEAMRVGAQ